MGYYHINIILCLIVALIGFFLVNFSYTRGYSIIRPIGVILLSGASFVAGTVATLHYLFP